MPDFRTERDSMGEVRVPADALYGAQTQRAVMNFPISGIRLPRVFIRSLGIIKKAAAETNAKLRLLDRKKAHAISKAAEEVASGRWDEEFVVDIFQSGSGTSTNMNANEVISRRANQIIKAKKPGQLIHPNDHVNMGQSSNDVIPSAIHLSVRIQSEEVFLPALFRLRQALKKRSRELKRQVKTGRTHLMDAVPVTFGQELGGWAFQVEEGTEGIQSSLKNLSSLALGGTAVGTGLNTHPRFGRAAAKKISKYTGMRFSEARDHFAAQSSMDAAAELSSRVKVMASALMKMANDLRIMNSGPAGGIGEISLQPLQPGSSIMPGKVNPVACEALIMVCAQVIANDLAVTIGNSRGDFQLNTMLPLIAHNLLQSVTILGNAVSLFADKAVAGFSVNKERVKGALGQNPVLATRLAEKIGYDRTALIIKRAYAEKRGIHEMAVEMSGLSREEVDRLLDPWNMV